MSRIWRNDVAHIISSCDKVMSHIWMSHVTHMNESCHTYEWVMSHIWMSHVTHMNELQRCFRSTVDVFLLSFFELFRGAARWPCRWMGHVGHMNESCHTYEWVMSHIWMSHVTHMNELRRRLRSIVKAFFPFSELCRRAAYWVCKWMGHVAHVTNHVTQMNESCHTDEWVMSHKWMSHVTYVKESCHTYEWVISHIWMRHIIMATRLA